LGKLRRVGLEDVMAKLCGERRVRALVWSITLLAMACGDDDGPASTAGDVRGEADAGPGSDAGAQPPEQGDDPTRVQLEDGQLEGDLAGDAVRFLKIPYAKPPVGALRWRAPEANEPWDGVRHETEFASPCPQPPSQQSPASMDEDCLYLNVWRPNDTRRGAPVMVWIHGGTTGSAADKVPTTSNHLWYDGRVFAERGAVVVTINYRLGVFGFFAHPALADEGSPVGNQGLLDQRHALRWVRDNIAAFGGDPNNVTIFGESAGAGSVCMHVASPGSRGLFHRAVSQSGGCTGRGRTDRAELDAQIEQYASDRGCEGDDALECLRDLPVSELVSAQSVDRTMGMDALRRAFSFGAVVDGEGGFLPEPAIDLFDRGDVADVPYILGTNTDEAQLYFLAAAVPTNDEEYLAAMTERYGDFAERVLEMYPVSRFDGDYRKTVARVATDSGLVCGTLDTARRAAAAGLTVYMYNFDIPWSIARDALGASHAAEISHVFGTPYNEGEESTAVADVMNAYWASFAKTGDPNFDGSPSAWPLFLADDDEDEDDLRLQFNPDFEVLRGFRKDECALWAEYAAR
jgi:para-nitrobenzyl esterase